MAKPQERIVDVSAAIHRWRVVLREKKYLNGKQEEFKSTSGKDLHEDLLEFTEKSTFKRIYRMKKEFMRETVADIPEVKHPVFVTSEEEEKYTSLENLTKQDYISPGAPAPN